MRARSEGTTGRARQNPGRWRRARAEGGEEGQEEELQGEAWRGEGGDGKWGSNAQAHHSKASPPSPKNAWGSPASLTTLSSGTERLRVHSWLFTKESVGEKATCQDWGGTHTCAIRHQLAPMLPLPRPRPEDSAVQMGPQPSLLVP